MSVQPTARRPLIVAGVMLASFMIAIEATIVSTAMPQIVSHLGNLHLYSWVFSSFLLAQTASTVVFGKLADLYGRKSVLLVGLVIFLVGSLLCGFAWSMVSLILFRLVQGLGAGATQPVTITIIGDLYPAHERGRVQGWLASVWGISSVIGPLAGGLIIQHVSWAWVFWINLPVGVAAGALFILFLHENVEHQERSVDVAGALLFTVAVASMMLALTEAGSSSHITSLVAAAICVLTVPLFVLQERRAADPVVNFPLWGHRPILTANAASLFSGMAVIGLTTFLPMYVQAVLNRSALVAGFTLTVMVLGWPIGATVAARNFVRLGLRNTMFIGGALLPIGAVPFLLLDPSASPVLAGIGSLVMGLGMGFQSSAAIVIIQESVGWSERGAATASNIFSRNLGSTLGAAVLGAVLNLSLAHSVSSGQIRTLIEHAGEHVVAAAVRGRLADGLHITFWGVMAMAVLTFVFALLVPHVEMKGGEKAAAAAE